jgi:hypothetical protein
MMPAKPDAEPAPTLEDQANGKDVLQLSTDVARSANSRRLTIDKIEQIIQLYQAGYSVQAIRAQVRVRWGTAARVLADAGLRPI